MIMSTYLEVITHGLGAGMFIGATCFLSNWGIKIAYRTLSKSQEV